MKWREKHEGFKGQRIVVVPRPVLEKALKDPLLRTLAPTDAGYYPKAKGHTCAREHGAPETIFIYCAEGQGWCEIDGRRHEVNANQLLVVPASMPHVYGAAKKMPWTIHWYHAVGANVPLYLERLGVTKEKPVVSLSGDVYLFSLFEEVVEALEHGFTLPHLIYAAHSLAHLMGLLLRHKEEHGYGAPNVREQIARSVEFMKGHLSEPLKVATLAALVNLSRSHYTTLFRRVTGYAPLSYLNHLRMQHAVQLLNSTDLPIKQISDQLGFSEQFYFSRAFSKMHNHSPSEHRRRYSTRALPSQSALVQAGDRESHGHISHTGWRASGESQCRRRLEHVRAVRINIRNSRLGLGRAGDCQNRGNEEMNQLEAAGFRDAL